jgi:D-beta-D-heptose 7-phosphate kinase/D-beta-D-heptose 1-phosphate adenosyltransferase
MQSSENEIKINWREGFYKNIPNVRVLVIGDLMLDRYLWGQVSRISPEAPVPIVNLERVSERAGGAANVAANINGLGAKSFLVGVIGEDQEAIAISDVITSQNISTEFILKSARRGTTVKTRVMAHNQQIVRVDRETRADLTHEEEAKVWDSILNLVNQVEVIIFSDYNKGIGTEKLLSRLITTCIDQGKLIFIDPKGKSYEKYRRATMLTPNRLEFVEACNLKYHNQEAIEEAGNKLLLELELNYLLVTQGEEGMTLFEMDKKPIHLPVELRNVYDVTGAGDTVIACLAVAFGSGANFEEAAKFANRAAGLVIEQLGTTAISLEMLNQ